tara:strand:+ start:160 stop:1284 length:1125 start_codon:yes stop_codon:yes gene_type:complete
MYFIKYVVVLLVILLIHYRYVNNDRKHLYWNKEQPVVFEYNNKEGLIINQKDAVYYDKPSNTTLIYFNNETMLNFVDFINKYFEQDVIYTNEYILWLMNNSINNNLLFGLKVKNKLCAVMGGNDIFINIDNKSYGCVYVDFLAVDKDYRNNNYTLELIAVISKYMINNSREISIFKSDKKQLPFKYLFKTNYYQCNINKYVNYIKLHNKLFNKDQKNYINLKKISHDNIETYGKSIYEIYLKKRYDYRLTEILDYNIFIKRIINKTLVFYDINTSYIYGFITYNILKYKDRDNLSCDIYYFELDDCVSETTQKIINMFVTYLNDDNIYDIVITYNDHTKTLIKNLIVNKSNTCYYYLYNYNLNNITINNVLLDF